MECHGYLGIDAGTQGLSIVFTNDEMQVVAVGECDYEMVPNLEAGCYEQRTQDWDHAVKTAMESLRQRLTETNTTILVKAIGISGQMHGEVLADAQGESLKPVRLWCDSRNETQGELLTESFGVKVPKRMTVARWLWTIRNLPDIAQSVAHITTPAGWIAYRLTGQWNLGIGDAAGMFPIDQSTRNYDEQCLGLFDQITQDAPVKPLAQLLPNVRCAGQEAGQLNSTGSEILGLPIGIPVAPAEGDQPAALAGSLIGDAGMVSVSFGTSVCANSVGDRSFKGVSQSVDHFCAADGKPINMVWLRNGTTFMNSVIEMFGDALGGSRSDGFAAVIPKLLEAPTDCGGLLSMPFMDDEPGLGVHRGGTAMFVGLNPENANAGNMSKAALLATMFNLRLGSETLDGQGFPRTELILTGGLTKTPQLGQLLADVFAAPVTLLESAEEGTAWGAALMAKFRSIVIAGDEKIEWSAFLKSQANDSGNRFTPIQKHVSEYNVVYERYTRLMAVQQKIDQSIA